VRDLGGLAGAAERRVEPELLELLRGLRRGLQRRPDRPRRDGVDPDAALAELGREVDGRVVDGRLVDA
jgi:hypothetical protein